MLHTFSPAVIESTRCPTCGGEGECPDCDPLPRAWHLQVQARMLVGALSGAMMVRTGEEWQRYYRVWKLAFNRWRRRCNDVPMFCRSCLVVTEAHLCPTCKADAAALLYSEPAELMRAA